jgi:tetratricopeptide (TPR) repeat protein
MANPKNETAAVVVPFGVPHDSRGLGLGLAALVQGFTRIRGEHVALAQLFGKRTDEPDAPPGPVEAFIPPQAWRDLAGQGSAPNDVRLVLTGAFEPPDETGGMFRLLAFDARDGEMRSQVDMPVDGDRAGDAIVDAVEKIWAGVGELGELATLRDLPWNALESVLRAERCVLHDPARGGPHDRLAAMMHLGRAIEDAPGARYPAGRLAVVALDAALGPTSDPKLAEAAVRAVMRASMDAPDQPDLLEAAAALHVRLGHSLEGEATALAALARDPARPRLYALLSEARRARGDLSSALRAVEDGLRRAPLDAALGVEHGMVLVAAGDLAGAERAWQAVLGKETLCPPAFVSLAGLATKRGDPVAAEALVDAALAARDGHPDVLRCALRLAHGAEAAGLARSARVGALARALLERVPEDAGAMLALAQSMVQAGDTREALATFARAESMAPRTALAAEAQRGRFAAAEPLAWLEVDSLLRAVAVDRPRASLDSLSVRAGRLALEHPVWPAWLALGVIERRRGAFVAAREALTAAIEAADGAADAHRELARALSALGDGAASLRHAERAIALAGETPAALGALGEALLAVGRRVEGEAAIARARALAPDDADLRDIGAPRQKAVPPSAFVRAVRVVQRWASWRSWPSSRNSRNSRN